MTHIEQADYDSQVLGGYVTGFRYDAMKKIDSLGAMEVLWMDLRWWQALGKARGWEQSDYACSFGSQHPQTSTEFRGMAYATNSWREVWHRFIDHLAEGKDAERFFKNL